jgi:hypothetical protein
MTSVILIAEAFYMPRDAILPLFDGWRRYINQILLKKAFVDHEIDYFFISTALGRTLLSNWEDSTHKTLYIIVC